jgi:hypothetical protein
LLSISTSLSGGEWYKEFRIVCVCPPLCTQIGICWVKASDTLVNEYSTFSLVVKKAARLAVYEDTCSPTHTDHCCTSATTTPTIIITMNDQEAMQILPSVVVGVNPPAPVQ